MSVCKWRGSLYVYNFQTRMFLVAVTRAGNRRPGAPDSLLCQWDYRARRAKAYKNPGSAHKAAARLNAELYRRESAKYPCAPVEVVTGEAARCLELINRRGG